MPRRERSLCWNVFLILLGALLSAGCASKATTGRFVHVERIDTELRRGVSTKMDVQRVLGAPNGYGSAILPTDPQPREVWYYDDIEVTDFKSEGGVIRANMRQQILLVFFERGVFDGFMWFSNAGETEARQ
jgi:hypothetical protein